MLPKLPSELLNKICKNDYTVIHIKMVSNKFTNIKYKLYNTYDVHSKDFIHLCEIIKPGCSTKKVLRHGITHLTLECKRQINFNIPNTITHLTIGYNYNHPIVIPNSVKYLIIGNNFNQPIVIPNSVVKLEFGSNFKQVVDIPNSVIHLTVHSDLLLNIPDSVETLIGYQHVNLPKFIKHVTFGFEFNDIVELPKSITHLKFGDSFNQVVQIPDNVIDLEFGNNFNQVIIIPESVVNLSFGFDFNQPCVIPNSVRRLSFEDDYNHDINVNHLEYLKIGQKFNKKINAKYIEHISMYSLIKNLPDGIKSINILSYYNDPIYTLPKSLEFIIIDGRRKLNAPPFILNRFYKISMDASTIYRSRSLRQ